MAMTIYDVARLAQGVHNLEVIARGLYRRGWNLNGEWQCPKCRTIIGKNLLGEKPYALAKEHSLKCAAKGD
jgi:hypothetical protein